MLNGVTTAIQGSLQARPVIGVAGDLAAPSVRLVHDGLELLERQGGLRNERTLLIDPGPNQEIVLVKQVAAASFDIDWDTQEMDCEGARATTLTNAKVIPDGYDADPFQRVLIASREPKGRPLEMLSLATFLYENEEKTGPLLEIPAKFTEDE